ncbi:unnamed protein product [Schistosoma mattheei]|uniref:Gamma tubulin complex component C-terminal domain-containing protein n=1 Tax=Schistosoma mattheei TaxID=31246 RepID=A0A183P709_9TREM|nr:unnamed protein product [Schistosoma mattheei]
MQHFMSSIVPSLLYLIDQWTDDGQLNHPYKQLRVETGTSVKISRLWRGVYITYDGLIRLQDLSLQTKQIRSLSRDSNLRYKEVEIPQRFNVHLLDISTDHYSGGGIILLDQHVSGALTTIFTNSCHLTYLFSFSFLRRAIRMEFTSSNLRKQWFCATRLNYDQQIDLLSVIHLFVEEIRYFIHQLQYYISFGYSKCV